MSPQADEHKLTAEQKANWLRALRSGKFQQGMDRLGDAAHGYCCLGVFCLANNVVFLGADTGEDHGPQELLAAIPIETRRALAKMNDNGKSFLDLANYIEASL